MYPSAHTNVHVHCPLSRSATTFMEKSWGVLVNKLVMAQSDSKFPFLFDFFIDSFAVSLYMDDVVEF